METNITDKAGLVMRTVDAVDHEGNPAKLLTAARTYDTTIDDLWNALTDVDRLARWFLPASGDLRPGGRFQIEGHAGGEVLACEPPDRFDITWEFGGATSWVTVELTEDGPERTRIELRHVAHVPKEMWDQFGPGAVGIGWDLALLGLDLHLASGEERSPDAVREWELSPDAQAFKAACSTAWGDASIASGVDPEQARAAAERAMAFYTPSEE